MSFIVHSGDEYDPLDPNPSYLKKRKYVYKSSSEDCLSEANFDDIEDEEAYSTYVGKREDEE